MAVSWHRERAGVAFGSALAVFATAALVILTSRSRLRLGVQGTRGEAMLLDLRERLRAQGLVPRLPADWHVDMSIRSAGGQSFAGDFLIAALSHPVFPARDARSRRRFPVDSRRFADCSSRLLPSGPGVPAPHLQSPSSTSHPSAISTMTATQQPDPGTQPRRRQRQGPGRRHPSPPAVRSLRRPPRHRPLPRLPHLGEQVPPPPRLGRRLRHRGPPGRRTGNRPLPLPQRGPPPIARLTAKTGRWSTEEAEGPLLGVLDDAEFPATEGYLDRGDALLLFTDGLVERPGRDLDEGLDRLLGAAETRLTTTFTGGADRLINEVAPNVNDDRALVVVWRT